MGINNAYLLVVDCIFSLTFFVGSFEVCLSCICSLLVSPKCSCVLFCVLSCSFFQ